MSKSNDFVKSNSYIIYPVIAICIALFGLYFTTDGYINRKIHNKITDTKYMAKLAKQLRPFLIFDDTGIVQYDHGAECKIKKINVDLENDNIIIETFEFMQIPPLIIAAGYETYSFVSERLDNRKWKYDMLYHNSLVTSPNPTEVPRTRFILELLY